MYTVHFPLVFNVPQLLIWEYLHYFWDTENTALVIFSFCCEVWYNEGKISFQHADSLSPWAIQIELPISFSYLFSQLSEQYFHGK